MLLTCVFVCIGVRYKIWCYERNRFIKAEIEQDLVKDNKSEQTNHEARIEEEVPSGTTAGAAVTKNVTFADETMQDPNITHDGALAKNDVSQLGLMDETINQPETAMDEKKTPEIVISEETGSVAAGTEIKLDDATPNQEEKKEDPYYSYSRRGTNMVASKMDQKIDTEPNFTNISLEDEH